MRIEPVTADRWDDLEPLFGPNGAYSDCWCAWGPWTGPGFSEADRFSNRPLVRLEVPTRIRR